MKELGSYISRGKTTKRFYTNVRLSDLDTSTTWLSHSQHFKRLRDRFDELLRAALDHPNVSAAQRTAVEQACGLDHRGRPHDALMSHKGTRRTAGKFLCQQLLPTFAAETQRRWFFITVISDIGNSLEYCPVIEVARLQRDGRKMLSLVNLHFIGVIELQLARYPGGGLGRTVQAHLHAIGYIDDPAFSVTAAVEAISKRSTLSNWLGAPVVDFELIVGAEDLQFRCDYMFKAPIEETWLAKDTFLLSGFSTRKGEIEASGALRLAELLSHLSLRRATLAHGDLVITKGDWIRGVAAWVTGLPARKEYDYQAAFGHVWSQGGARRERADPIFRFDASQPVDPAWTNAMQPYFATVASNQAAFRKRAQTRRKK